jgi:hypothetical protein
MDLLSYKEPDGADDDLRHTDLKMRFYDYFKQISDDQQVIIVENTEPYRIRGVQRSGEKWAVWRRTS